MPNQGHRRRLRRLLDRVITAALCVVLLVALVAILPGAIDARFSVSVDLAGGVAEVDGELRNLRHPVLVLWLLADAEQMAMTHLEAFTEEGDSKWLLGWGRWRVLFPGLADTVRLRYDAHLGVTGRHGYQGRIEPDFALMPTRLLMWLPSPYWAVEQVHLQIHPPPGQEVLCAWPRDDDGWYAARVADLRPLYPVMKSAVAVGHFTVESFIAGGQEIRIATHRRLGPELGGQIQQRALAIFAHMQELLGFELQTPYLNIFVPAASDGGRIFGASWSLGHAYEMKADDLRGWELFSHRIGHVFNRDAPYGLEHGRLADRWFYEGLASWIEIPLTVATGIADDDGRFGPLFRRYWRTREKMGAKYDRPPDEDWRATDSDVIEWLHYTKYPLLLVMLDYELRGATGDPKNGVEGLFARLYQRYGNHAEPIPDLRPELEAFAGRDLGWFFERYVESDWPVLPLWHRAITLAEERMAQMSLVARLDGEPVFIERNRARRLTRRPSAALASLQPLLPEVASRVVLERLGLRDVPDELARITAGLDKSQRAAVAAHRRRTLAEYFSVGGCKSAVHIDAFIDEQLATMKLEWAAGFEGLAAGLETAR